MRRMTRAVLFVFGASVVTAPMSTGCADEETREETREMPDLGNLGGVYGSPAVGGFGSQGGVYGSPAVGGFGADVGSQGGMYGAAGAFPEPGGNGGDGGDGGDT
jgi:hypothetical protein